jgi:hypothetical protein
MLAPGVRLVGVPERKLGIAGRDPLTGDKSVIFSPQVGSVPTSKRHLVAALKRQDLPRVVGGCDRKPKPLNDLPRLADLLSV